MNQNFKNHSIRQILNDEDSRNFSHSSQEQQFKQQNFQYLDKSTCSNQQVDNNLEEQQNSSSQYLFQKIQNNYLIKNESNVELSLSLNEVQGSVQQIYQSSQQIFNTIEEKLGKLESNSINVTQDLQQLKQNTDEEFKVFSIYIENLREEICVFKIDCNSTNKQFHDEIRNQNAQFKKDLHQLQQDLQLIKKDSLDFLLISKKEIEQNLQSCYQEQFKNLNQEILSFKDHTIQQQSIIKKQQDLIENKFSQEKYQNLNQEINFLKNQINQQQLIINQQKEKLENHSLTQEPKILQTEKSNYQFQNDKENKLIDLLYQIVQQQQSTISKQNQAQNQKIPQKHQNTIKEAPINTQKSLQTDLGNSNKPQSKQKSDQKRYTSTKEKTIQKQHNKIMDQSSSFRLEHKSNNMPKNKISIYEPKKQEQKQHIQILAPEKSNFKNKSSSSNSVKVGDFTIVRSQRDGNCFYEALSITLFSGQKQQTVIRDEISKYFNENYHQYDSFIPFYEISENIKKNGEYASYPTLKIAADLYQIPILLFRNRFYPKLPNEIFTPINKQKPDSETFNECIKLLFTGKPSNGHYDPVIYNSVSKEHSTSQIQNINLQEKIETSIRNQQQGSQQSILSDQNIKTIAKQENENQQDLCKLNLIQNQGEQKELRFLCGCNQEKCFKNFNSLRQHFYQKHKGVPPDNSSHDMKGIQLSRNNYQGSC